MDGDRLSGRVLRTLGGLGHGIPLRATITGFGPLLPAEVLQLNHTQEQSLGLIFHYADQKVLELPAVQEKPQLFSTFLMWLPADLFHDLPEIGDADRPRLVFFFDEAHPLFSDAPKAFLDAITQTVRLIRSKGVWRVLRHADPEGRAR